MKVKLSFFELMRRGILYEEIQIGKKVIYDSKEWIIIDKINKNEAILQLPV